MGGDSRQGNSVAKRLFSDDDTALREAEEGARLDSKFSLRHDRHACSQSFITFCTPAPAVLGLIAAE